MITLRTPMPGPRAREAIARDHAVVSQSYTRDANAPVVAESGDGVWLWDADGNRLLDFTSGIATCSTGHCHPVVVKAITDQAQHLIHMSGTDFYYAPQIALAERAAQTVPGDGVKRVFFGNSGAEAIEAAIKLVRYKTGRQQLVSYQGAFHGRTMGALSLSASKAVHRLRFGPLVPGVLHMPYPYCYRCPLGRQPAACDIECLEYLTDTMFKRLALPDDVAAVFIEPIQGEGGYVPAPDEYLRRLRDITNLHGIMLVVDEVQCGMGRTGKMFAFEWAGIEPDVICLAKGVASGMPLGLTIYRSDGRDWGPGAHASTFGGNPLSRAAALATLDLLEGGLIENAARMGERLRDRLEMVQKHHSIIGDVRGRGLMMGAEIVEGGRSAPHLRSAIVAECYWRGLIVIGCGESTLRFAPALVITADELDEGLEVFEASVAEVEMRHAA